MWDYHLSIQFARSCTEVIGIDVDPQKVELLNKGQSYIKHIASADIAELRTTKKFSASTDFSRIKEVEAVIICVPTPLNKNREPNLSYVLETGRAIAPYLKSGEANLNSLVTRIVSGVTSHRTQILSPQITQINANFLSEPV